MSETTEQIEVKQTDGECRVKLPGDTCFYRVFGVVEKALSCALIKARNTLAAKELTLVAVEDECASLHKERDALKADLQKSFEISMDVMRERDEAMEYINDHVHRFIDFDEIENLLSFHEWKALARNEFALADSTDQGGEMCPSCDKGTTSVRALDYVDGMAPRTDMMVMVLASKNPRLQYIMMRAHARALEKELLNTRPAPQLQEIIDAATAIIPDLWHYVSFDRDDTTAKRVAALMDAIDYDGHQRETAPRPFHMYETTGNRNCDTCASNEGGHYCLMHTLGIKNGNLCVCNDWTAPKPADEATKETGECPHGKPLNKPCPECDPRNPLFALGVKKTV